MRWVFFLGSCEKYKGQSVVSITTTGALCSVKRGGEVRERGKREDCRSLQASGFRPNPAVLRKHWSSYLFYGANSVLAVAVLAEGGYNKK